MHGRGAQAGSKQASGPGHHRPPHTHHVHAFSVLFLQRGPQCQLPQGGDGEGKGGGEAGGGVGAWAREGRGGEGRGGEGRGGVGRECLRCGRALLTLPECAPAINQGELQLVPAAKALTRGLSPACKEALITSLVLATSGDAHTYNNSHSGQRRRPLSSSSCSS